MNNFRFSKLKNKLLNIHRTIIYSYIKDPKIKGNIVKYGKNNRQYYKVYNPDTLNNVTIFFVHGGGWWHGNPSLYSSVGKYFYKMGYNSVIVGYRLAPFYRYPSQIEDVFTALKHYSENNVSDNIIVSGYSAGGELSTHLVFDTDRQERYNIDKSNLRGFISISGVLNFLKCKSSYSKFLIKNYIYEKEIKDTNPINLLDKDTTHIPIMCIHGDSDSLIDSENSISFINKARSLDKNTTLKIIEKAEHEDTIDIIRGNGNKYSKYILNFIKDIEQLKQRES